MEGASTGKNASTASTVLRAIGQGLWMIIPVASLGVLAWVPAAQVYWKARTFGWLAAASLLALASVAIVVGMALDGGGAGWGAIIIAAGVGGVTAAATGRAIVFGRQKAPKVDPALKTALENRERRRQAREIAERDPALALELRIGRPDLAGGYADGGLVDLNNATAEGIAEILGWDVEVARSFVSQRDERHGYTSLTEIMAMSNAGPRLLEAHAERVVVLPYQHRRGPETG